MVSAAAENLVFSQAQFNANAQLCCNRSQRHGFNRVYQFFSDKYDITKHPNNKYLSNSDPKNAFDMEKHIKRRPALVTSDEVFDHYEIDETDLS